MESGPPTLPPYVTGPLRLAPFAAFTLAPRRVGDPASARVFARPYRGVPERLESWCRRGLAQRDELPAVYLHEYCDSGLTVRGLVGCLDVSHRAPSPERCQVFPHEGVHPRQVSELAARMRTMRLQPAPILLVHHGTDELRDISRAVRTDEPQREYTDHAGQQHRVWAITDRSRLEAIDAALADARLVVADGHHRFAAYVALQDRYPDEAHGCGLAMVVDQDETPMFLGAIHRLLSGTTVEDLLEAAALAGAQVCRMDGTDAAMAALAPDTLVLTDGESWATVTLRLAAGSAMIQRVDDVLLGGLARPPDRVAYAHSVAQAVDQARPGRITAALLPAVDLDLVLEVVGSGAVLPEKTTSFQPKPSLGSFMRALDE